MRKINETFQQSFHLFPLLQQNRIKSQYNLSIPHWEKSYCVMCHYRRIQDKIKNSTKRLCSNSIKFLFTFATGQDGSFGESTLHNVFVLFEYSCLIHKGNGNLTLAKKLIIYLTFIDVLFPHITMDSFTLLKKS